MEQDIRDLVTQKLENENNFCIILQVNPDNPIYGELLKTCLTKQEMEDYVTDWNEKVRIGEIPNDFMPQLIIGKK